MSLLDFFSDIQGVVTVIGVIVAAVGLTYAGKQLRESRMIARGNFILHLDEMFRDHIEVHTQLHPGGHWAGDRGGPESVRTGLPSSFIWDYLNVSSTLLTMVLSTSNQSGGSISTASAISFPTILFVRRNL